MAVLSAGNMKADETRTFTHDNEDYSINTLWINLEAVSDYYQKFYNGEVWLYSPFFFVKDDVIYMTKDASATQSTSLMAIDGKSGNFKEIIPMIRKVAKKNNLPIIDLHTAMDGIPQMFPDKIHPNEEGAKVMAKAVYQSLKK